MAKHTLVRRTGIIKWQTSQLNSAVKMKLSTLSIIPPCSGNKSPINQGKEALSKTHDFIKIASKRKVHLPKSFIPESRFSIDAVKSPTRPRNANAIPCIGPVKYQYGHCITILPKVAIAAQTRVPPKYPSTVLLGLAAPAAGKILPNLFFPYLRPVKYAPTSENAMLIHVQKMKTDPALIGEVMNCEKYGKVDFA